MPRSRLRMLEEEVYFLIDIAPLDAKTPRARPRRADDAFPL